MTKVLRLCETISNWDSLGKWGTLNQFGLDGAQHCKMKVQFMTWHFQIRLNQKISMLGVKVMAPESWEKYLGVIWAVNCDGVCEVLNVHNFLKI